MERRGADVTLEVLPQNALRAAVDVLVLKYAQDLYGLDEKVVQLTNIPRSHLPPLGGHRVWPGPPGMGAGKIIFVGVPERMSFGYAAIRQFARQALNAVAGEAPTARVVGMTLHGAGFGLDEVEAFQAELAGLFDAAGEGLVRPGLERISFLEIDTRRARRMSQVLADVVPSNRMSTGLGYEELVEQEPALPLRTVGTSASVKRHALVAMPFAEEFEDAFHFGISSAVRQGGLLCERIDKQAFTGDVMGRLKERISSAALVVADLTDAKPNVFLEVGFAWGRDVPTVLLCKDGTPLEFDVQGQRCLFYKSIRDLERQLTDELKGLLA
jgi:hypothetical protein